MTAFQMFKSAKVKRLERQLAEMTEARDTLQAVIAELNKELAEAKFNLIDVSFGSRLVLDVVRMERDNMKKTLTIIAKHGTANPAWAVKLAKAAVE